MTAQPEKAAQVAQLIDDRIATFPKPALGDLAGWRERDQLTRNFIDELGRNFGARYRCNPPDNHRLTIFGISRTCTAGPLALLSAWSRKAKDVAHLAGTGRHL